ncbi:Major facilitator superfamily domain general substrate transporter [Penicillium robsamsonii]|uniref:Major facilitator superfamily domain general substrate transporter n=1 Tax=Penicillium robsamsonii TaxID=1792511 RepID=UPI002549BB07|nr:Major facilitator superfamily domain general substrate transporter [Penicillium robsamsonii]KAJ5817517.1 Major facilitator superfamily domain general substrate transporter [Penicillium robsamsonii]
MGLPETVQGRHDGKIIDQTIVGEESYTSQNEKSEAVVANRDKSSLYDPESPPRADSLHAGDMFDDEKELAQHPDSITEGAELGQQKAEAAALVWSLPALVGIYAWIWICTFMLAFHSNISSFLINYIQGGFRTAPQVSTAYILANVVGGVLKLPIGKTLNLWGRAEALVVSTGIYILGMVILAACDGPNGYAAGYVLYWIGYYCIYLILNIFVADTSGLRNRAFAFGFMQTPFICTAFTGGLAANSIYAKFGWRWGYGIFCIVMPFTFLPLAMVFKYFEKKAEKKGIFRRQPSGRTVGQSIIHYIHEFDVIGAFFLMIGWVMFLLPFSLAQYGRSEYSSASFIALIIIGVFMLFVFAAWEKWGARTHFIRYELIKRPTILGACLLSAVLFFSFELWDQYFYNYVLISYDISAVNANYMLQIYNIGSCFFSPVIGAIIWATAHFKYICLFFGAPLMILGSGLMIYFRGSDHGIGYVVMCQIFIAFAGGTLVIGEDMAVMAAGGREGTPMMLALIGLFSSIGGGIGLAVGAAIYNNVFVNTLTAQLPDNLKANATQIYFDGIPVQSTYPWGSPLREAVAYTWGYAQRLNCIASTAVLALTIPCILVWKNYDVNRKQNKGRMIF